MLIVLDLIIIISLILVYRKAGKKFSSASILWVAYAIIGYVIGYIGVMLYTITFQESIVDILGKEFGVCSFLAASIAIEFLIGFIFLEVLKRIYSKRNKVSSSS